MRYNAKEVREAAQGHWAEILSDMSPELVEAVSRAPRHGRCPVHGGRDGFRLFRDYDESGGGICNTCGTFSDGLAILQWVNGWNFSETLEKVADHVGMDPVEESMPTETMHTDPALLAQIQSVWRQTIPDDGTISNYLRQRGLSGDVPASLRLHPSLPYYDSKRMYVGSFPAICAPIQNHEGEMVSIHRTFLSSDGAGKAPVDQPKKVMQAIYPGATRGGAIRLGPVTGFINLTEGIETAIAVMESTNTTSLAAVSANNLERFAPPAGVRAITIWADNDESFTGQRSAAKAMRRLMSLGFTVEVKLAPVMGKDWLDILTNA